MEIYFINTENFSKTIDSNVLLSFLDGQEFKSKKRVREYCIGRFLLKFVLENCYNIREPEIIVKNKKPCLADSSVHFSLSHSNNIVAAVFDNKPVALDIEVMKERDFEKLFKYHKLNPEVKDKETFYRFWTEYESEIKLQEKPESTLTKRFLNDFMLCVASLRVCEIASELEVYEIFSSKDLDTVQIQQMTDSILF